MDPAPRFKQARDRGCAFLLRHQGIRGDFPRSRPALDDYYKVLTAFQVCGHNDAANRLCQWIRSRGTTPEGDFGPKKEGASGYSCAYFNAWVILGTQRLGQLDLATRGIHYLLGFQDEETGGFYSDPTERGAETRQDLMVVSLCGLACLSMGRTEEACRAASWLKNLMEAQPDFPKRLYTVRSRQSGLHTEFDPDEALRHVVVADSRTDQAFFNPGIAAGFLCRLFQVSRERKWLDLAIEYMRFAEGARDELFRLIRAGKVGWGASLLFRITGEQKYRAMALRIGDNLIRLQSRQGYWSGVGQQTPSFDSTAERVVWMDEIAQIAGG